MWKLRFWEKSKNMRVGELIEKLNKCNSDADVEVCINIISDDALEVKTVTDDTDKSKIFIVASA